jgi:hypothetical protein
MVNITLSMPNALHARMARHPEIKWTEVIRRKINEYLDTLEEVDEISSDALRKKLNIEPEGITEQDIAFAEKMVQMREDE